ncbi:extracellular solute-binding protein [Paenibacillus mesophilus]|uniref:extracellular solute-binding protein n=1 Tax=Paenibacillus mesophilus TaxID=2582849 RepID=UPI001EE48938|nr:extracellular solute-binding protein [Paenibacillus mesophilus]
MSKQIKAVSITVAVAMLALMGAACGKADDKKAADGGQGAASGASAANGGVYPENGLPKDQKVTLKVGFFESGMGREWFDYAMDSFKKKFPNVSFEVVYSPKIDTIIGTKISAGNDQDMFDLFSGSIPGGVEPVVAAGKLEPQEDLWDRKAYDGGGKTLKEIALDGEYVSAPRVLGKTYALPNAGTSAGLMFDKNMFVKNGWNQNPKTWEEFLKLCEDIKAKGIIPITFPGQYPGYLDYAFGVWKQFELAEINGNLKTFEDNYRNFKLPQHLAPENIERWNRVFEMGKKGYFPEGVAALNHTQSQMQVLQGKAAMVSSGTWVQNEMKESTPKEFKWGFMAVPMSSKPGSTIYVRLSAGNGNYIWAAKPELNKKWAKEFNVWLWNLDVQTMIADKGGMLPVRKDFSDDPVRASKIQDAPKAMYDYMKTNKVMLESGFRNVSLTDPAYQQSNKVMNEAVTQIALGKQDPMPVLQEAEALLKKAIEAAAK